MAYNVASLIKLNKEDLVRITLDYQGTSKACVCYFLSNYFFSSYDRPSKTMKNGFYFI